MKPGQLKIAVMAFAVGMGGMLCFNVSAEELDLSVLETERDSTYYQTPTYRPDPRSVVIQKAQARAYQREARLASMSWYGQSNSRPQAAVTPFTSRYSPLWETPGGKPYAWYPTYRWPGYAYYVR